MSIPRLPINDAVCIMNQWLATNHRTLTDKQRDILLDAFEKCSLPIFLKVSFEEALRWKSYTSLDEIRLESTVRGELMDDLKTIRNLELWVPPGWIRISLYENGL